MKKKINNPYTLLDSRSSILKVTSSIEELYISSKNNKHIQNSVIDLLTLLYRAAHGKGVSKGWSEGYKNAEIDFNERL